MKKFAFLFCLVMSGFGGICQQQYFVYIQTDDRQPFYAKIDKKIYSSSESGYMIIPKLSDSTYQIAIGFAKAAIPEQQFPVTLNKKDNGFELKNFGEKGWGLFNLQTLAVVMNKSNPSATASQELTGEKKTDAFSELLANVVNDSAILYTAAKPKAPEPLPAQKELSSASTTPVEDSSATVSSQTQEPTVQQAIQYSAASPEKAVVATADTNAASPKKAVVATADTNAASPKKEVVTTADTNAASPGVLGRDTAAGTPGENTSDEISKPTLEKPFITKTAERRTDTAYSVTYLEQYNLSTDTIRISIPANDPPLQQGDPVTLPEVEKPRAVPDENRIANVPEKRDSATAKKQAVVVINSDCKNFASENDVDKLRVRLLANEAIDDKLSTARKYFRTRCFTVKQILALSELYPTDETKYRFFEVSYPFISDPGNFYLLEETLHNELLRNRFKGLIGK